MYKLILWTISYGKQLQYQPEYDKCDMDRD